MAVASSGTISLNGSINGEFARGSNTSNYRGTSYYSSSGSGTFPTSNLNMQMFYGKSPDNEWNCACACDCICGK